MAHNMADNDLSGSGEKRKKYSYALRPFLASLRVAKKMFRPKNEGIPYGVGMDTGCRML
jgi:hypothetical protein